MRWVAIFEDDPKGYRLYTWGKAPAYGSVTL
jgi:hypothetical protein